ncbi:MAG: fused MFS/spermidine synthase [Mariprofundus sp.]|nr:fused MFS/spermidine synthase [Mariprofundus sp.]
MNTSKQASILLLLYGLSGVTALAYEVLWTRMLSLLFGVTVFGVVITVAAFMLGLGLGSFMGSRWFSSIKNTLRLLAGIEVSVAIYALLLPLMMQWLQGMWLSVDDVQTWQFWQMFSALWVLCIPATALGFAFPAMLRVGKTLKVSLGSLYGVNTIGGALGALLPLLLLPLFGWLTSLQWVAALGVSIALGLFYLSIQTKAESVSDGMPARIQFPQKSMLLAYAGMGAGALMLEIAWTRAYGMILLRTEYVLAVILAVFLIGIGLGSVVARHLLRERALQVLPMLVAVIAIVGLYLFPYVNDWGQRATFDSLLVALLFQGMLIALCTLPVTLALGAWLPLIANHDEGAFLYAANSVGACIGALLAGFVLIPWIGTAATWLCAAGLVMLCACFWVHQSRRLLSAVISLALFTALSWPVWQLPSASRLLQAELPAAADLFEREDAISITHVIQRQDGQRLLLADLQRMDASSDPTSVAVQQNQARLPMFLQANAKDVLFLGLGTGITASGALPWAQAKIEAIELSQGAITAAQYYFDKVNSHVPSNISIVHDDARRFLMRSGKSYDVIVGDLFHPDMVGRGALLSLEQFQRAKSHLTEQGLFVQWLAFNQFDKQSMQVVLRSFAQVFENNALFVDGYRLGMVGFMGQQKRAAELMLAAPADDLWGGEGGWTWLGRYWGTASDLMGDSGSTLVQGEWSPVIEFDLPHLRHKTAVLPELMQWLMAHRTPFKEAVHVWTVNESDALAFKRAWASTELSIRAQIDMLQNKSGVQRLQSLAYRANAKDRWAGFALADAMFASLEHGLPQGMTYEQALQQILTVRTDHEGALKAMIALRTKRGDLQGVQQYKDRFFHISPYDSISF